MFISLPSSFLPPSSPATPAQEEVNSTFQGTMNGPCPIPIHGNCRLISSEFVVGENYIHHIDITDALICTIQILPVGDPDLTHAIIHRG